MKAKKLIAGAAALTLALASAFAVLPAEKANAASVVTTPVYTNDFWGRPSYNHEFTLDNGENRLKDGLDEDEMYNLSMKASGAGTGKLTIVFTNGPDQDECIWYLFAVPEGSINVSESGSWLKEDLYAREETCTFNLTFDSKGKLTNVDDLKAPANGYFLFSFVAITPVPSDKGNSMYRMYIPTAGSTSTRQTWPKGTSCSQPAGSMKASPGQLRRLRRHRFTASTIPTAATTTTQRTRPRRAC